MWRNIHDLPVQHRLGKAAPRMQHSRQMYPDCGRAEYQLIAAGIYPAQASRNRHWLVCLSNYLLAQWSVSFIWFYLPFESIWLCVHSARGAIACRARIFTSLIAWLMPKSRLAIKLLNKSAGKPASLSGKNSMRWEISLIYCWQMLGI